MCEWTRKKFVFERKMIDFQKLKVSKSALLAMVSILDCADCTVLGMKSPFLELEGLFVNET
jgi:hypothetical protein